MGNLLHFTSAVNVSSFVIFVDGNSSRVLACTAYIFRMKCIMLHCASYSSLFRNIPCWMNID